MQLRLGLNRITPLSSPYNRKSILFKTRSLLLAPVKLGLGQRFADVTEQHWKNRDFQEKSVIDVGRMLAQSAVQDFFGTGIRTVNYGALVAVSCRHKAELIEFAVNDFQPEVKTRDIWYASMGSGQLVADPLLGFIRKTFWGDSPPSRQDGVFAVTMVLKLGCEMAPTGVAEPIQIAVLSPDPRNKGKLSAFRLTKEELLEHEGNVESAIEYFSKYRESFHKTSTPKELPSAPPS